MKIVLEKFIEYGYDPKEGCPRCRTTNLLKMPLLKHEKAKSKWVCLTCGLVIYEAIEVRK